MSRRDQIRMSEAEIDAFLRGARTIILCRVARDGAPHPMPMWFGVEDDGAVVMTTFAKSQKGRNLERDPRVSLLVEDGEEYAKLRGVAWGAAPLRDGSVVAATGGGGARHLLFFSPGQVEEVHALKLPNTARGLDVSASGTLLATAHFDARLRLTRVAGFSDDAD